jgi:phenylpyruvate tautomerase PptA (4-oxalocrotonate tautomerase family)
MPLLRITTNQTVTPEIQTRILKTLSAKVAALLGKSENYVMTAWLPAANMTFGGQAVPAAYIELDSIGLAPEQAKQLSQTLCATIADHTEIETDAIYIKFYDAPRALWGWNGSTFG